MGETNGPFPWVPILAGILTVAAIAALAVWAVAR
jgi:hypothetical protein